MTFPELKPRIWIPALIRRAEIEGAFAAIVRKGDPDGGTALVLVRARLGLMTLYKPVRNMEGERVWWQRGPEEESLINAYVNDRVNNDPDLWVVEIEDKEGRHFLLEPIELNP